MAKSPSVVKNKNARPKKKDEVIQSNKSPLDEASENPLDFGGLPPRNLKKNLGC